MPSLVLFEKSKPISNPAALEFCLRGMFGEDPFVDIAAEQIRRADPTFSSVNSFRTLLMILKVLLGSASEIGIENADELLGTVSAYDEEANKSINILDPRCKQNPLSVFWPMPTRVPIHRFDMWPLAKATPILDMTTPIGSAGSCFAIEIAKVLQEEKFNYVITERHNDAKGVRNSSQEPDDTNNFFSANYGLLFNTPSFRQLAEKAFGTRKFEKILYESQDSKFYFDPYREDVCFFSPGAFIAGYEKHIAAVKDAFLKSEVFIITLGLNECWQLLDGTFMSRNPRFHFLEFAKHRTLTVAENVENIQVFYDIIKAHNPKFKLIVTVSPVPLIATGRADDHHVIVANTHSKAVLRVAAEEVCQRNEDAYYFPSYEMVTQCIRDPWDEDDRHVTRYAVEKVVQLFKYQFLKGCEMPVESLDERLRSAS